VIVSAGRLPFVRFRILGPVVLAHDGTPVEINAARERTVLAVLVLRANQVVTVESLLGALWEGDHEAQAHAGIAAVLTDDPMTAIAHWERALALHTDMGTPERHAVADRLRMARDAASARLGSA
jgi:hypothetical protein